MNNKYNKNLNRYPPGCIISLHPKRDTIITQEEIDNLVLDLNAKTSTYVYNKYFR